MSALNESKTPLCRELLAYFVLTFLLGTACILGIGKSFQRSYILSKAKQNTTICLLRGVFTILTFVDTLSS